MKKPILAVAIASALALAASVDAQPKTRPQGQMMEAVVTVTKVDPMTRAVTVRAPKGETLVQLPADFKIEDIRPGSRYRVRYGEPVAVAIMPGAQVSAAGGATAVVEPRRDAAAGMGIKMEQVSGVVESIDPASRRITVRRLDGGTQTFTLAADTAIAGRSCPETR